jgi:hypothetical protein
VYFALHLVDLVVISGVFVAASRRNGKSSSMDFLAVRRTLRSLEWIRGGKAIGRLLA